MAKKIDSYVESLQKIPLNERIRLINNLEQKDIFIQDQLKDLVVVNHEHEFQEDGTVDIIYYMVKRGADLMNKSTVIYKDRYSARKRRETAAREHKKRRRRA